MTRQAVIWSLVVASVVGVTAVGIGTMYWQQGRDAAVAVDGTGEDAGQTQAAVEQEPDTSAELDAAENSVSAQDDTAASLGENEPSFDVVGVEPTGDAVIAGRSEAGSIVALTANGTVVGKGIADQNGEWTIILDQPLEPGDYDVGLEVQDEAGDVKTESRQRLAVSIPENRRDQPLVVLNSPDAPSDVLQLPAAQEVASASPQDTSETDQTETAQGAGDDQAAVAQAENAPASETPAQGSDENTVTALAGPSQTEAQEAAETPAPVEETAEPTAAASEELQVAATDEAAPVGEAPADASAQVQAQGEAWTAEAQGAADTGLPEAAEAPAAPEEVPSETLQANSETALAETSQAPAEEAPSSETPAETGAPVETAAVQTAPSEDTPAVDAGPASAEEPETQVAAADTSAPSATAGVEQPGSADTGTAPSSQATSGGTAPSSEPAVTVEAVESEEGKVFVAGTGEPGTEVRVYVDDSFAGEAQVTDSGRWLVEGSEDIPEGDVEVRADLVETGSDEVEARAAVTFEKDTPEQIVLTRVVASGVAAEEGAQTAKVAKPLPNVIIRKGDNLWRISRRLYGQGIRYTTIYQANQDQIRDPDLIYPGQVFLTPQGDVNWPENGTASPVVVQ